MTTDRPPLLRHHHTDEFAAPPWSAADRRALASVARRRTAPPRAVGLDGARPTSSPGCGTAATLRAIDAEAGGGFYAVPAEAEHDQRRGRRRARRRPGGGRRPDPPRAAERSPRPAPATALFSYPPHRRPRSVGRRHRRRRCSAAWRGRRNVFGLSETAVALLTSPPGRAHENVLTNDDIATAREIVDRYAGTGRVLAHTIVHPNLGAGRAGRDGRVERHAAARRAGRCTRCGSRPRHRGSGGWFLDDDETGGPFLERCARRAARSSRRTRASARRSPASRRRARRRATSGPPRPRTRTSRSSSTTRATRWSSARDEHRRPRRRRRPARGEPARRGRAAGRQRLRRARLHLVPRVRADPKRPRTCSARCCAASARTGSCGAPTRSGTGRRSR